MASEVQRWTQPFEQSTMEIARRKSVFNKGEGGFRDGNLDVFCANASDGTLGAIGNPNLKQGLGMDIRAGQYSTGKAFGVEIYAAMQKLEGHISEVSHVSPTPGADDTHRWESKPRSESRQ
jgi:hypothetical protein